MCMPPKAPLLRCLHMCLRNTPLMVVKQDADTVVSSDMHAMRRSSLQNLYVSICLTVSRCLLRRVGETCTMIKQQQGLQQQH